MLSISLADSSLSLLWHFNSHLYQHCQQINAILLDNDLLKFIHLLRQAMRIFIYHITHFLQRMNLHSQRIAHWLVSTANCSLEANLCGLDNVVEQDHLVASGAELLVGVLQFDDGFVVSWLHVCICDSIF